MTTWTSQSKSTSESYLLQENGDFLLYEDNGKIILAESPGTIWRLQTKS